MINLINNEIFNDFLFYIDCFFLLTQQLKKKASYNTFTPFSYHVIKLDDYSPILELPCDNDTIKNSRDWQIAEACIFRWMRLTCPQLNLVLILKYM